MSQLVQPSMKDNLKRKIKVNGEKIWLDEDAYSKGQFKVSGDAMSEQCSDCGVDIAFSGKLEKQAGLVRCSQDNDGCGTYYRIEQVKD